MFNAVRVLLLSVCVLMPCAVSAQVTISFNQTPSATGTGVPTYPGGGLGQPNFISQSSTIYLASELGIPSGAVITGIEWFRSNSLGTTPGNTTECEIWLRNTTSTVNAAKTWTAATGAAGATRVYHTLETNIEQRPGWTRMGTFNDNPFVYTGDSLEVMVRLTAGINIPWTYFSVLPTTTVRSVFSSSSGSDMGAFSGWRNRLPHVRFTCLDADGAHLRVERAPVGDATPISTQHEPLLSFSAASRGAVQTLNSIKLTKLGTIADSDVSTVALWNDANGNGFIDPGVDAIAASGQFSSGEITFPSLGLTLNSGEVHPLIVSILINPAAPGGSSYGVQILNSSSVVFSGTTLTTTYPMNSGLFRVLTKSSALPYVEGFDSFNNVSGNVRFVPVTIPGPYTTTGMGGVAPTNSTLGVGDVAPITIQSSVNGNSPQAGAGFADGAHQGSVSFTATHLHFDLSGFTTANWLELSFWWNNVGLAFTSPSFASSGVFLSTDGGASYHAVLHIFQTATQNTWQKETIAITPIMQALSLSYTNDIVIRISTTSTVDGSHFLLDSLRLEEPAPRLDIAPGMIGGGVPSAKPRQLVGAFDFTAVSSNATVNDLTIGMTGTAAFSDVTDIELFLDDGDGVFSAAGDTPVGNLVANLSASGEAVFSGPSLFTISQGQKRTLWATAEIDPAVAQGSTVGFAIQSASSINSVPTASAAFPASAGTTRAVGYATALPFDENFGNVTGVFPDNALPATGPGTFPSAANVGATITSFQSQNPARLQVDAAFANYSTIGRALGIDYPNGDAMGALDFFFDLSALSTATHDVELGFRWMHRFDEDSDEDGVFLSIDGGATWLACLYRFPMSSTTSNSSATWPNILVNLSSVLAANNVNFTSRMVVRFQGRGEDEMLSAGSAGTRDGLMVDDVTLSETPARLDVSPNIGVVGTGVRPGVTGAVIGGFDFIPFTANHPLTDVSITKSGSLADSMLSNVQLWFDTDGNSILDPGVDVRFGAPTAFAGGVADFIVTTPVTLTKSRSPVRAFVVADVDAAATAGENFALSIDTDTDVVSTAGNTVGAFPVACRVVSVVIPGTTPYQTGFETLPVSNLLTSFNAGWYPAATNTGSAVYLFQTNNAANVAVGNPATNLPPHAGASTAGIDFAGLGGSSAAGALDFYMDLSGFDATTDIVTFSFAWNSVSNQQQDGDHVLVSVDGGHRWYSVYRIPVSTSIGVWTVHSTALSVVLNSAGVNFTQDTVVRIQSTGALQFDNDGLLLDSVEIRGEPRLRLETIGGSLIGNGSIDLQGPAPTGASQQIGYRIRNVAAAGSSDLLLTGIPTINIVTSLNAGVSLSTAPTTTAIAPAANTTYTLDVTPQAAGSYVVEVVIDSNDPAAPNFRYFITGTAVEPEIDVQRPAGTSIASGGTDPLGSIAAGIDNPFTYIVVNGGSANLNLTGTPNAVQISAQTNCTATVTQAPPITNLAPAAAAPFTIGVNPGQGAFSFTVTIPNSDPDEGAYTFTVSGNGADTPEIDVKDSAGTSVGSGSFHTLSGAKPGSTTQVVFTIENNGNADLNLVGTPAVEIVNLVNCTVTVSVLPSTPVLVGGSTTFTLDVRPSSASFNFRARILNDDANEGTYQFTVVGVGVVSKGGGSDEGGGCSTADGQSFWYLLTLLAIPSAMLLRRSRRNA